MIIQSCSEVCGYVRAHLSICVVRATQLYVRGSRIPSGHMQIAFRRHQWEDQAGLGLFQCLASSLPCAQHVHLEEHPLSRSARPWARVSRLALFQARIASCRCNFSRHLCLCKNRQIIVTLIATVLSSGNDARGGAEACRRACSS